MSWWNRLKAIFKNEASDVKEGLGKVGKSIDDELARKEKELAATPGERIDMILEEQQAEDARFQELQDKVLGKTSGTDALDAMPEELEARDEATRSPEDPSTDETGV